MERDALLSEIRQRNRERLPRLIDIDIERRASEGYALSRNACDDMLDGMESASSSLALADPDPCEIVLARRILLWCESIRLFAVANDQRRHKARFQTARG
ncbi:hypothetical protein CCR95_22570 [Thiocystis minor]|uniref:hypothetical protein n=1 Tax=Thiocystis minor TaxID=61597 RepID=UPI001913726B|nr:hypothetical protein [Thiocystis minor]MBK5966782.1 hypothetical protein [Thiocystis minor]